MEFNPGETYKKIGNTTYLKDSFKNQVDKQPKSPQPVKEKKEEPQIEIKMSGEPSLEPIIEEIKKENNDPIQHPQVASESTPKRTRTSRKRSKPSSNSN